MQRLSVSAVALKSGCWRCEVQGASAIRHFCVSNRRQADGGSSNAPRTRAERSQDSFRQISQLPKTQQPSNSKTSTTSRLAAHDSTNSTPRFTSSVFRSGQSSDPQPTRVTPVDSMNNSSRGVPDRGSFQARGDFQARGARGGRGGIGGRARGGGRGGRGRGGQQPQRRSRSAGSADEDDDDPRILEAYADPTNYEIMIEQDSDAFTSTHEIHHYAQVVDMIDHYHEKQREADYMEKNPDKFESHEVGAVRSMHDGMISDAMQHVIQTDELFLPRYIPKESTASAVPDRGGIGDIPVGSRGMANTVENDLRYIAKRDGMRWQDPKELAEKLVAGELVKFRNLPEKHEVLGLAEALVYEGEQDLGSEKVGFEPPSDEAKRDIVERIASGRYADPNDEKITQPFQQSVLRLINGNASYPAEGKRMLLGAIQRLTASNQSRQTRAQ